MTLYRRLARSKKGMSTIFGALFFIILVLMGFNLMVWNFVQFDAYNHVITSMSLRDQQATSENLVVVQPGAVDLTSNSFNITVTNLGGNSIIINRVYINNLSPTGSPQCSTSSPINPCTIDTTANTASCISGISCYFTGGNIQIGELNHKIGVHGITVNDGSGYKIILATTRGRLFSFFYPWPVSSSGGGGGTGGLFQTNIGPLSIYFDYKSFNFTQGSQTQSQSAFCIPSSTPIIFWIKLANTSTLSSVTLKAATVIQMQGYGVNGFGQFITDFIVNSSTTNPTNIAAYNDAGPNAYILPAAGPNGPSGATLVKFGAGSQSGTSSVSVPRDNNWIMFMGFYYVYQGQVQGETIPFLDIKSTSGFPGTC